MKTLSVYGSSDDLVEIEGISGADEFPLGSGNKSYFNVGGKLKLTVIYDGCWQVGIGQLDEDIPLPDWPIQFSQHSNGYSVLVKIEVPDDTYISEMKNRG